MDKNNFSPELYSYIYRTLGVILLCLLWVLTEGNIVGLFFILIITILILLRWRLNKLYWTIIIDQVLCLLITLYWPYGIYGLTLSIFDAVYLNLPWISIPTILYTFYYIGDYNIYFILMQSFLIGLALWGWKKHRQDALLQFNLDSKRRYELECLKNDLLNANIQITRMAELSERSRIAREIHDHAGHEIIAAYMSLQVVEDLIETDTQKAKSLYTESMKRLESGIDKIRECVHNLAPLAKMGIDYIQTLCNEFTLCPVDLQIYGDSSKVPVHLWSILEPCLKESFSNILRHSKAKKVTVTLDITSYIVRLSIENDGIKEKMGSDGIGLRNLKQRARAVGGSVSTDQSDVFRVICVLPLT